MKIKPTINKLTLWLTLVSFALSSCHSGSSASDSTAISPNVSTSKNHQVNLTHNAAETNEDMFNSAILDSSTHGNPFSIAGSLGIELANSSNNQLFSLSRNPTMPLYEPLNSVASNNATLQQDILEALQNINISLNRNPTDIAIFNNINTLSQNSSLIAERYKSYTNQRVLPAYLYTQPSFISKSAAVYCQNLGKGSIAQLDVSDVSSLYDNLLSDSNQQSNKFEQLRKSVLPTSTNDLSTIAKLLADNNLMGGINQYNAKVISYYIQSISLLKELYAIQITQASLYNDRYNENGCSYNLKGKVFTFNNIKGMPQLNGNANDLKAAIVVINETYKIALDKLKHNLETQIKPINETELTDFINHKVTNNFGFLDQNIFSTANSAFDIGKCSITSISINENTLTDQFKAFGSYDGNKFGVLSLQAACRVKGTDNNSQTLNYRLESAKIPYLIAKYNNNSSGYITSSWVKSLTYGELIHNDQHNLTANTNDMPINHVHTLHGEELTLNQAEQRNDPSDFMTISDTVYEYYPVAWDDHVWYPKKISLSQGHGSFVSPVFYPNFNNLNDNEKRIIPRPGQGVYAPYYFSFASRNTTFEDSGYYADLKSPIILNEAHGYKTLLLANDGTHVFGIETKYTITNEPDKGTHFEMVAVTNIGNVTVPILQKTRLVCIDTAFCRASSSMEKNREKTTLIFYDDGSKVELNHSQRIQSYMINNSTTQKFLQRYNKNGAGQQNWTINSTYENMVGKKDLEKNRNNERSIKIIEHTLPSGFDDWSDDNLEHDYNKNIDAGSVFLTGAIIIGIAALIAYLLTHPNDNNPQDKFATLIKSPDGMYRFGLDLNDYKLKLQKLSGNTQVDQCYVEQIIGASDIALADGQIKVFRNGDLAWSNQLLYSQKNLQWVADNLSSLKLSNSGVLNIVPSSKKGIGFYSEFYKSNVIWETYKSASSGLGQKCMDTTDTSTAKEQIKNNNGEKTADQDDAYQVADYALSHPLTFDYGRDSLEDIPVGTFGLKTIVVSNISKNSLTFNFQPLNSSNNIIYDEKRTTCKTSGAHILKANESCHVAYRFTPSKEGQMATLKVSPSVSTTSGGSAHGAGMDLNVYSRIPSDKPTGSYSKSCKNIIWLNGVLSASCSNTSGKEISSKLEYFKNCSRKNGNNSEVDNKDGLLTCANPL